MPILPGPNSLDDFERDDGLRSDKASDALTYLTNIANAFDPVEGPVQFEPDTWTRIRNAIYDLTPRSAGVLPKPPDGENTPGELLDVYRDLMTGALVLVRNWFTDKPYVAQAEQRASQAICRAIAPPSASTSTAEEPYFILNGYRRRWNSYSHFDGQVVSYDDVVEWSGINSDSEVVRERVYTVTYSMPHGSARRDGSLTKGESAPFESGMVFNVSRTSSA